MPNLHSTRCRACTNAHRRCPVLAAHSCGLASQRNALAGPALYAGLKRTAPSAQLHRDCGRLSQIAMYLDNDSFEIIPAARLTATLQYQVGSMTVIVLETAPSPVQESKTSRHSPFDPSHAAMSRQRILRLPVLNAPRAMDLNQLPLPSQASAKLRRRSYGKSSLRVRREQ